MLDFVANVSCAASENQERVESSPEISTDGAFKPRRAQEFAYLVPLPAVARRGLFI
jgi:hypothetical protein